MSWNKVLKLTWDPIKYSAKTIKNLNNKLADNMTESGKSDTPAIISTKINTAINRGNWERWNLRLNKIPKIIINGIKNKVLISLVIKAISVVFSPYNVLIPATEDVSWTDKPIQIPNCSLVRLRASPIMGKKIIAIAFKIKIIDNTEPTSFGLAFIKGETEETAVAPQMAVPAVLKILNLFDTLKTKYNTTPRKLVIVTSTNTKSKLSEAILDTWLTLNTRPRRMIAIFNR